MDASAPAPRSRLVAVLLSGFVPGLGHSWTRRPLRGLVWVTLVTASLAGWIALVPRSWTLARVGLLPALGVLVGLLVDSARAARDPGPPWRHPALGWTWHALFIAAAFALPAALGAWTATRLSLVLQDDGSMRAAGLQPGDRVLCDRALEPPPSSLPGTVVAVARPDEPPRLLRVVAAPGDRVAVQAGVVVRNGRTVVEDLRRPWRSRGLHVPALRLGDDEVAALTDARTDDRGSLRVPLEAVDCIARYVVVPGDFDLLRAGRVVR